MKLVRYQKLISSLPVRDQSFEIKRSNQKWKEAEEFIPWFKNFNDKHFADNDLIKISRSDIFKLSSASSASMELIIKIIFWGYPNGMQGYENFKSILLSIDCIEEILKGLSKTQNYSLDDFNKIAIKFKGIKGIGLSTYSKLLYFSDINFEKCPSLILDRRLINVFSKRCFEDFESIEGINYDNATKFYIKYLKIVNNLAEKLGTKEENIEQFLFLFGNNVKA